MHLPSVHAAGSPGVAPVKLGEGEDLGRPTVFVVLKKVCAKFHTETVCLC